jgi:inositol polyphosphate-4-phosphatase
MRFNKQELTTLATQPSQKFDKEGVLFLRERQEGFFRRTESEFALVVQVSSRDFFITVLF